MTAAAGTVRSGAALLSVMGWLAGVALPSILALSLASAAVPARRMAWISIWARANCRIVLGVLRLGGARFRRTGRIDTSGPGIIVMNHQSVLDIPTAILMSGPVVPGFVARKRYASVPVIATGLRLAACPVIDPKVDREKAMAILRDAAWQDRTLLIFPEAHRTPDGSLQPFRTAGLLAILGERRMPVWLVATDGFCSGRRLLDMVLNVHRIRGRTELVGRFDPPADAADLPAFVDRLEAELASRLRTFQG